MYKRIITPSESIPRTVLLHLFRLGIHFFSTNLYEYKTVLNWFNMYSINFLKLKKKQFNAQIYNKCFQLGTTMQNNEIRN